MFVILILLLFAYLFQTYLELVFNFNAGVDLIKYNSCGNIAILWLLVSSILSWLIHTLSFLEDFHKTSEILFAMVDDGAKNCKKRTTSQFNSDEYFMQVIISEEDMFWAYVATK